MKKIFFFIAILFIQFSINADPLPELIGVDQLPSGIKGSGIKIAVIEYADSQKDIFYPLPSDLKGGVKNIVNTITSKEEITSHACAVTSLISSKTIGIAPDASVDLILTDLTPNSIEDVFVFLNQNVPNIITFSFGNCVYSDKETDKFSDMGGTASFMYLLGSYVDLHDCLVITSAGNLGREIDMAKAQFLDESFFKDRLIFAGSINFEMKRSDFSDFPSDKTRNAFLWAPGECSVLKPSSDPLVVAFGLLLQKPDLMFAFVSGTGTSLAAPVIAAVAALVKQKFPEKTTKEIREMLFSNALMPDDNPVWGNGILKCPDLN